MRQTAWPPAESMTNPELGKWISINVARLQGVTEFPSIEINAIAAYALQKNTAWIAAHPETRLDQAHMVFLEQAVERLTQGEPLAYITGKQAFYGLDFFIDSSVLIPRPETELLVELAIDWLKNNPGRTRIADVGTGSGAIAVTLAKQLPDLQITATDVSARALTVAKANAAKHRVTERIEFIKTDLLEGVVTCFDLILANLPYIPSQTLAGLPALGYEPHSALDGGADGLDLICKLITTIEKKLLPKACVILEIQYNQGVEVTQIAAHQFPRAKISMYQDLASLPRVVLIQL